jgi:phage-related protein
VTDHSKPAIGGWTVEALSPAVEREMEQLSDGLRADLVRISELLKAHGPHRVGMPYVRPLGDKLWEMRLRDATGNARAIYVAASKQRLVILHVFRKTTRTTPRRVLKLASKRLKELT